jgi:transcriptional regulator with XRE-family HTH domain
MAKRPVEKIDFRPYGAAVKKARTERKESRNKVGNEMFLSPRYLANIENKGQHPSVQIFLELMSRYHVSVDQILFGEAESGKSTASRQLDTLVGEMSDREIQILIATAQAILDAREDGEK